MTLQQSNSSMGQEAGLGVGGISSLGSQRYLFNPLFSELRGPAQFYSKLESLG